jgi:hypothetical protein
MLSRRLLEKDTLRQSLRWVGELWRAHCQEDTGLVCRDPEFHVGPELGATAFRLFSPFASRSSADRGVPSVFPEEEIAKMSGVFGLPSTGGGLWRKVKVYETEQFGELRRGSQLTVRSASGTHIVEVHDLFTLSNMSTVPTS